MGPNLDLIHDPWIGSMDLIQLGTNGANQPTEVPANSQCKHCSEKFEYCLMDLGEDLKSKGLTDHQQPSSRSSQPSTIDHRPSRAFSLALLLRKHWARELDQGWQFNLFFELLGIGRQKRHPGRT
jgi:hypothetical protein